MSAPREIDERDRDRALRKLRWLTALSGIASLAVAALSTSAAAQASTPTPQPSPTNPAMPSPTGGALSQAQLQALDFALPKPATVVIWRTGGQGPAASRGSTSGPAAAPAPRPAPPLPPPPVATTGTS
ncbi:MAG TPA: hypothetical protein VET65_04875 [Candidatus Limnocylindrales bacterium]|nr:hypothetical protein [Candidatus Limnocylindrales bacterium]